MTFIPKAQAAKATTERTPDAGRGYNCKSKKGEEYVKIQIVNGPTYLMFVNKNKKEERHPDFRLILKTDQK